MKGDDSREILVELSNEEIEEFRVFYKNLNNPEFIHVHLYLRNQLKWNLSMKEMPNDEVSAISDRCKLKFYKYKHGNSHFKTLIGITGKNDPTIFISSLDESELRICLEQTELIDWNLRPMFASVLRRYHKLCYEVFEKKKIRVRIDNYVATLWLPKEIAKNYELANLPEDVEMREIGVEDCEKINEKWPYKYPGSVDFIKSIVKLNGGLGIYKKNEIVSWILHIECFGFGLLQTLDEHQGKGYARFITRAITKKISSDYDEDVILFASYSKPKTVDLYIRYGFKHISYTHWLYLK
jgi:Domain of unknown function (DUF5645)/FR47-like protein